MLKKTEAIYSVNKTHPPIESSGIVMFKQILHGFSLGLYTFSANGICNYCAPEVFIHFNQHYCQKLFT
jgi:hypothetical protein